MFEYLLSEFSAADYWEARELLPIKGSLERVLLEALIDHPEGVTFMDLVGTGITEENIDQIADNLHHGMYIGEEDDTLRFDA